MELFKPGVRRHFMKYRKTLMSISVATVVLCWAIIGFNGLNFGIDFAGGTEVLVRFESSVDIGKLRTAVEGLGLDKPEVVTYGLQDSGRYFIRSRTQSLLKKSEVAKVRAAVVAKLGEPKMWDESDESGEELRVQFEGPQDEDLLQQALVAAGFTEGASVGKQSEGSNPVYILRLPGVRQRINSSLAAEFGADNYKGIDRLESVGSAVGEQMRNQGILAVIYALIGILLYISFRFDLRYSPGAIFALIHDVSITVGVFSITGMEFNLPIIAALLAIVGYSLNDTIVVYDRVRETLKEGIGDTLLESIDISISDCLSRTVLTSVTTFLAVLAIYIYGGGIIQNFSFAMLIGVIVGTYSSIYIASPIVVIMDTILEKDDIDVMQQPTATPS